VCSFELKDQDPLLLAKFKRKMLHGWRKLLAATKIINMVNFAHGTRKRICPKPDGALLFLPVTWLGNKFIPASSFPTLPRFEKLEAGINLFPSQVTGRNRKLEAGINLFPSQVSFPTLPRFDRATWRCECGNEPAN